MKQENSEADIIMATSMADRGGHSLAMTNGHILHKTIYILHFKSISLLEIKQEDKRFWATYGS